MTDRELNLLRELLETLERDEGACYKDRSHVKRLTFGKALPTTKGENNHESNS